MVFRSNIVFNLLFLIIISGPLFSQDLGTGRGIWSATPLSYPTIARLAQIQGDVELSIQIDKDGKILSAATLSGPDALASVATKEIIKWRYTASEEPANATITVHYALEKPAVSVPTFPRVTIENPLKIIVTSNYPEPTGHSEVMKSK